MIELHATVTCDRCLTTSFQMNNVENFNDAVRRLDLAAYGWCEDEDGNEVCAQCWCEFDAAALGRSLAEPTET